MDQGGLHGEGDDGEELDLGLLLLPRLDGVEEPHGVEQPHRHVAPLVLLPVHLLWMLRVMKLFNPVPKLDASARCSCCLTS